MAVEIYKGEKIIAENAFDTIDVLKINQQCDSLRDTVSHLRNVEEKLSEVKSTLSRDAFTISGSTLVAEVEEVMRFYEKTAEYILKFSNQVSTSLENYLDEKQLQFNQIAMDKDMESLR